MMQPPPDQAMIDDDTMSEVPSMIMEEDTFFFGHPEEWQPGAARAPPEHKVLKNKPTVPRVPLKHIARTSDIALVVPRTKTVVTVCTAAYAKKYGMKLSECQIMKQSVRGLSKDFNMNHIDIHEDTMADWESYSARALDLKILENEHLTVRPALPDCPRSAQSPAPSDAR